MSDYEADRAAAFASQADKSRELAAGHLQQAITVARSVQALRDNINRLLAGWQIEHRWVDYRLDIMGPDGEWVIGPDLRGLRGARGPGTVFRLENGVIQSRSSESESEGDWSNLLDIGQYVDAAESARNDAVDARGGAVSARDTAVDAASTAVGARGDAIDARDAAVAAAASVDPDDMLSKASNLADLGDPSAARTNLGLGDVDNTPDAEKPVSDAQQMALDAKLDNAGGTMTGALNMGDQNIHNGTAFNIAGKHEAVGSTASNKTFDVSAYASGSIEPTGNITIGTTGWPAGDAYFVIEMTGGGDHTIAWTGIAWDAGEAPDLQAGTGVDKIVLFSRDGGSAIRGKRAWKEA